MNTEYKAYDAKMIPTKEEGVIRALVSVFGNVDRAGERVMPGAFTKSIATRLPYFVFGHQWDKIVGKTISVEETSEGLVTEGLCNLETQLGRETYSNCKMDALNQFSIGYQVVKDNIEAKSGVRELHELLLHEWSPVLVGMNPSTALLSVKAENLSNAHATLAQHSEAVLATCEEFAVRIKSLRDLRAKEGRVISAATRGRIQSCVDSMQTCMADLTDLMAMPEQMIAPPMKAAQEQARRIHAEILRTLSQTA